MLAEAEGKDPEALLRDGARRVSAAMLEKQGMINLLLIEQVEFSGRHVLQLFDEIFPPLFLFAQKLQQGSDVFKPYPPLLILRAYVGLILSSALFDVILADTPVAGGHQESLDHLMDIFMHGVLEPE